MKNVLLVGASGGIGNKTAENLLQLGYFVFGTYYQHPEHVKNLETNQNFSSSLIDLKDSKTLKNLHQIIVKEKKNLYAVINCAGICEYENKDLDKDLEIWDRTLSTDLSGNYYLAKIFYDLIDKNGRFLMISSTDAYYGGTITASYAASKAGVISLTKSLSLMFKEKMIRVNSLAPGWVETSMIAGNGKEFLKKVANINPLKRNAQPQDISNVFKFLLSDDSEYINGQVIPCEGGYTNQDPTLLLEQDVQEGK